jgi:hypothetical protein
MVKLDKFGKKPLPYFFTSLLNKCLALSPREKKQISEHDFALNDFFGVSIICLIPL